MFTRNALICAMLVCSLTVCTALPVQAYGQESNETAEGNQVDAQELALQHDAEGATRVLPSELSQTTEIGTLAISRDASSLALLKTHLAEFVSATEDMTIQISASFNIDETVEVDANSFGKTLTLTSVSDEAAKTLTRDVGYYHDLLKLHDGANVVLSHLVIHGNKNNIDDDYAYGSLIQVEEGAELIIEEGAELRDNKSSGTGGAIQCSGSLVMHGGTIAGNMVLRTHDTYGGGIFIEGKEASLYLDGGIVGGFTEDSANEAVYGGGVCVIGEDDDTRQDAYVITGDAQIIGNRAGWDYVEGERLPKVYGKGAGVYHQSGTLLMSGGTIARNRALGPTSAGGGVENYFGKFIFTGGVIGGSSIEDANIAGKGGGICTEANMLNAIELGGTAKVSNNCAGRVVNGIMNEGIGGGVLLAGQSSGTLSSATIMDNQALGEGNYGSGVYVMPDFTLYIKGAPAMSNNTLYTTRALGDSLVLLENLTGGSLVIQGSYTEGQMAEGVVVARSLAAGSQPASGTLQGLGINSAQTATLTPLASPAGFAVNSTTASVFRSVDGQLVGKAQGDTVVWAHPQPQPVPKPQPNIPPTGDGAAGVLAVSLLLLAIACLALPRLRPRAY